MDSDAAGRSVQKDAGCGLSVIGDAGTGGHGKGAVAGAGHDDRDALGGEPGAQMLREGECDGLFVESGRELGSKIGYTVGGVQDEDEM